MAGDGGAAAVSPDRFIVRNVELSTESEGPDYFTLGEFQVVESATGRIVARFPWSLDEPYLTNASYSGPDDVRISEDGSEAVARQGREETRVLLPPWGEAIEFDGVVISPDADFGELARRAPDGQWLWKLYERLGCTEQAETLARAIGPMMSSADPRERSAAAKFYCFAPEAPGFEQVMAAAGAGHRLPDELLRVLAKRNPVWVKAHAAEIGWKEVLAALYAADDEDFSAIAARLVRTGVVAREEMLRHAAETFPGYGLAEIERALA
jgi:hypothetical protein